MRQLFWFEGIEKMTEKAPASSLPAEQPLEDQTVTATDDSSATSQLDRLPPLETGLSSPRAEGDSGLSLSDKRSADGGPEGMSEGEASRKADDKQPTSQKSLVGIGIFESLLYSRLCLTSLLLT